MFEFCNLFDQWLPSYFLRLVESHIDKGNIFSLGNPNNIFSILNQLFQESSRCLRDDSLQYLVNQTITNHFTLQAPTYIHHKCHQQIKCTIKPIPHLIILKFQSQQVKILLYEVMICLLQAKYILNCKLPHPQMSPKLVTKIRQFYFNLRIHYSFSKIEYSLNEFMDYAIELLLNTTQLTTHYKKFLHQIIQQCDLNETISSKILKKINQSNIPHHPQNTQLIQYASPITNPNHFNQKQVFRCKKINKNTSRQLQIINQSNQLNTPIKNQKQLQNVESNSITSKKRFKNTNQQVTPQKQIDQNYRKKHSLSPHNKVAATRLKSYGHRNQTLRSPLKRILQKIKLQTLKPIPQRTIYLRKKNLFIAKKFDKIFYDYLDNKDRTTVAGTMTDIYDSDQKPPQKKPKFFYDLRDLDVLVEETPKLKKIKKSQTGYFDLSGNFMFKK